MVNARQRMCCRGTRPEKLTPQVGLLVGGRNLLRIGALLTTRERVTTTHTVGPA